MSMEKIFKNLALANILLTILYFIAILFVETDYGSYEEDTELLLSESIFGIILIIYLIGYLYSNYLLYKFKPLGKKIFLPLVLLNVVFYVLIMFVYEDVTSLTTTNLEVLMEWIFGFISGCLVIFIYFTPIKDKFLKQ